MYHPCGSSTQTLEWTPGPAFHQQAESRPTPDGACRLQGALVLTELLGRELLPGTEERRRLCGQPLRTA